MQILSTSKTVYELGWDVMIRDFPRINLMIYCAKQGLLERIKQLLPEWDRVTQELCVGNVIMDDANAQGMTMVLEAAIRYDRKDVFDFLENECYVYNMEPVITAAFESSEWIFKTVMNRIAPNIAGRQSRISCMEDLHKNIDLKRNIPLENIQLIPVIAKQLYLDDPLGKIQYMKNFCTEACIAGNIIAVSMWIHKDGPSMSEVAAAFMNGHANLLDYLLENYWVSRKVMQQLTLWVYIALFERASVDGIANILDWILKHEEMLLYGMDLLLCIAKWKDVRALDYFKRVMCNHRLHATSKHPHELSITLCPEQMGELLENLWQSRNEEIITVVANGLETQQCTVTFENIENGMRMLLEQKPNKGSKMAIFFAPLFKLPVIQTIVNFFYDANDKDMLHLLLQACHENIYQITENILGVGEGYGPKNTWINTQCLECILRTYNDVPDGGALQIAKNYCKIPKGARKRMRNLFNELLKESPHFDVFTDVAELEDLKIWEIYATPGSPPPEQNQHLVHKRKKRKC